MDINELRAEVRKRQQAANAKARRLRAKGVEIEGTQFDPRRNAAPINRYTKRQLNDYLSKLNEFTSRSNQFVPLSGGSFVPAREWRKYRTAERRYNQIANREYGKVADLKLPLTGMTVSERDATMRPTNRKIRRAAGEAVRRIYEPVNIRPENVEGPEALRKLTQQRQRQISRPYKAEETERQRREMRAMLDRIGESDMMKEAEKLTDEQFSTLWNYGTFATDLSRDYERIQLLATGGASAQQDRVHEDARQDILESIEWAQSLPTKKTRQRRR